MEKLSKRKKRTIRIRGENYEVLQDVRIPSYWFPKTFTGKVWSEQ